MNRREIILLLSLAIFLIANASQGLYVEIKAIVSIITLLIVIWNIKFYIQQNR
jgi:hypothetical protein